MNELESNSFSSPVFRRDFRLSQQLSYNHERTEARETQPSWAQILLLSNYFSKNQTTYVNTYI